MAAADQLAPTLVKPIPDQAAAVDVPYEFTFHASTFYDPNSDPLTYTADLSNGRALPAWLSFDPTARKFSGTPGAADRAVPPIRVTADDGNNDTDSDIFNLEVVPELHTLAGNMNVPDSTDPLNLNYAAATPDYRTAVEFTTGADRYALSGVAVSLAGVYAPRPARKGDPHGYSHVGGKGNRPRTHPANLALSGGSHAQILVGVDMSIIRQQVSHNLPPAPS